jgi:hypothetical protein
VTHVLAQGLDLPGGRAVAFLYRFSRAAPEERALLPRAARTDGPAPRRPAPDPILQEDLMTYVKRLLRQFDRYTLEVFTPPTSRPYADRVR